MKIKSGTLSPCSKSVDDLTPGECFRHPAGEQVYMLTSRRQLSRQEYIGGEQICVKLDDGTLYFIDRRKLVIPVCVVAEVTWPAA